MGKASERYDELQGILESVGEAISRKSEHADNVRSELERLSGIMICSTLGAADRSYPLEEREVRGERLCVEARRALQLATELVFVAGELRQLLLGEAEATIATATR